VICGDDDVIAVGAVVGRLGCRLSEVQPYKDGDSHQDKDKGPVSRQDPAEAHRLPRLCCGLQFSSPGATNRASGRSVVKQDSSSCVHAPLGRVNVAGPVQCVQTPWMFLLNSSLLF